MMMQWKNASRIIHVRNCRSCPRWGAHFQFSSCPMVMQWRCKSNFTFVRMYLLPSERSPFSMFIYFHHDAMTKCKSDYTFAKLYFLPSVGSPFSIFILSHCDSMEMQSEFDIRKNAFSALGAEPISNAHLFPWWCNEKKCKSNYTFAKLCFLPSVGSPFFEFYLVPWWCNEDRNRNWHS